MRKVLLFSLFVLISSLGLAKEDTTLILQSPDKKIEVRLFLTAGGYRAQYAISYNGQAYLNHSRLGLIWKNREFRGASYEIGKVENEQSKEMKDLLLGERSSYLSHYNRFNITLLNKKTKEPSLMIVFRCYNEGIAFRYKIPATNSEEITEIEEEETEFSFVRPVEAWVSNRAQSEIYTTSLDSISEAVERPVLVKASPACFLALGEAETVNFARMKFIRSSEKKNTLVAKLGSAVKKKGAFSTPWRYVMIADHPAKLLENNYFVIDLNKPNRLQDVSWIKPGKVIREVTLTTQGGLACIDFAVKHNLQYIEFDAGWYGNEYSDSSDATRVAVDPKRSKGPLDLKKVIEYGKEKGIGVLLYVNRIAAMRQLDTLLPLYESWGIKGVKYGFVNVGDQTANEWIIHAVQKAAEHHLMVDIHDEYRPTGFSRTYPNLLTQEGVRGDEESPPNHMVLNTLFTRMIAGAADQTNCYFAPRVEKMGSHTSQLAKAICIFSPFQFLYWYDRPEGSSQNTQGAGSAFSVIRETPELSFFDSLPTVWDETKVLQGYPGEYGVIARRKGNDWYIGCLTGKDGRAIEINLNFLKKKINYNARIYFDDPGSATLTRVGIEEKSVTDATVLSRKLAAENGWVIVLTPESQIE